MDGVYVVGVGFTKIDRLFERSARDLFAEAMAKAIEDAGGLKPNALVVGNMTSSVLMEQDSLGALMADYSGLRGVPAFKVEAACGSGGAAFYTGYAIAKSGLAEVVAVGGVEKLTEMPTESVTKALAQAADADYELIHGISFTGLNAMVMRLYMNKYGYMYEDFAHWPVRMHEYGSFNPYAQLRNRVTIEQVVKSQVIADPIKLLDCSPIGDGAAVVLLVRGEERAREVVSSIGRDVLIEVAGVGLATDSVDIASRRSLLTLDSVKLAAQQAYSMAGVNSRIIDYVEVHDAFSITGYVSLESLGFSDEGKSVKEWMEGRFAKGSKPEVNFSGGLKARGHPVGATGVYQVAEVVMQLRGDFPGYRASDPEVGLTQNIGGVGTISSVIVLRRRR
ncbi:MAG: thiolase domain-containing protein [Desulfurococcaceae archaeon]|nr:thiolase domain-containing protein [Sulfolobales archaeon]MDW8170433.1 thiolase domain-containing protein [Desulfurococcaceae archaeon]